MGYAVLIFLYDWETHSIPAKTRGCNNDGLMLGQRRRRRPTLSHHSRPIIYIIKVRNKDISMNTPRRISGARTRDACMTDEAGPMRQMPKHTNAPDALFYRDCGGGGNVIHPPPCNVIEIHTVELQLQCMYINYMFWMFCPNKQKVVNTSIIVQNVPTNVPTLNTIGWLKSETLSQRH